MNRETLTSISKGHEMAELWLYTVTGLIDLIPTVAHYVHTTGGETEAGEFKLMAHLVFLHTY